MEVDAREPAADAPTTQVPSPDWRWVGVREVEVLAPAAWDFAYEALRPDCIDSSNRDDTWARDVPVAPYVTLGTPARPVPAIGCNPQRGPGDPDPAFGALPFSLWQPFVKLERARPDLDDPDREDGQWHHRDWQLDRRTIAGVQITVLAAPDRPTLGQDVLDSARQVRTTSLGCEATSPVQAEEFTKPSGAPIPAPQDVQAIAICEYSRIPGRPGLEGSRRITGQAARSLIEAIRQAPRSGGPDRPDNCTKDDRGDTAIALRAFGSARDTASPLAEVYVYYDWCFGNGIADSEGLRKLTRANCAPLFAEPPVGIWSAQGPVARACGPLGAR